MVEKSESRPGGVPARSNGRAASVPEPEVAEVSDVGADEVAAELGSSRDADLDATPETLAEVELVPATLDDAALERAIAALLFAANEPLSAARLAALVGGGSVGEARVEAALQACGARLAASGLPFDLRALAGGWQLFTSTDQDAVVTRLARVKKDDKVSPASLETLSIIAYRQPVTKAEIEAIRGVQVGPILRSLVDRGFVRVAGRAEVPGHPLLYGTTKKFLDAFGLASLEELPRDAELVRD